MCSKDIAKPKQTLTRHRVSACRNGSTARTCFTSSRLALTYRAKSFGQGGAPRAQGGGGHYASDAAESETWDSRRCIVYSKGPCWPYATGCGPPRRCDEAGRRATCKTRCTARGGTSTK